MAGAGLSARGAAVAHPPAAPPVSLDAAYAYCKRIANSHYENFTVASWLMPRAMRPHMYAIYAYARIADDFADELHDLGKLNDWERELDYACAGAPRHPVMVALADTIERFNLPAQPFRDLLAAFRSDVDFKGFETLDDLLAYSRNSANPVGRLVLYLFGYRDEERQRLSDLVCTGLQLANFWQDVAVDLDKGRIYLPRQDLAQFRVTAAELLRRQTTANFAELLRYEAEISRRMLVEGSALLKSVDHRLRRDILMFCGGGLAILRAIERVGCDVFQRRPTLSKLDYLRLGLNAIRGRLAV